MKLIILTESQVERLISEQILLPGIFSGSKVQKTAVKAAAQYLNMDPHTRNTLLAIGANFVPYIGPALSMGISAYDAAQYRKEGKNKEAGLALLLAVLPGISAVVNEVPGLKQLGIKGVTSLIDKVINFERVTPLEMEVLRKIGTNPKVLSTAKGYLRNLAVTSGVDAAQAVATKGK
jgi:hypothetical protein